MKAYINLFILRSAPKTPVATAHRTREAADKNRTPVNRDLVWKRCIEVEI